MLVGLAVLSSKVLTAVHTLSHGSEKGCLFCILQAMESKLVVESRDEASNLYGIDTVPDVHVL